MWYVIDEWCLLDVAKVFWNEISLETVYFSLEKVQVIFSAAEERLDGDMGSTKNFHNVNLWEQIFTVFSPSWPNCNGYDDQTLATWAMHY